MQCGGEPVGVKSQDDDAGGATTRLLVDGPESI
jgi:hypothetical protein